MKIMKWLLVPSLALILAACTTEVTPGATVADLTESYGELGTLNALLGEVGLDEALAADGEFTVFAPTEEAVDAFLDEYNTALQACLDDGFIGGIGKIIGPGWIPGSIDSGNTADLDRGDLVALAESDPEIIADLLLYHVLPGEYFAADVVANDGASLETLLSGAFVTIDGVGLIDETGRSVGIVATDYVGTNGVVHFIDNILLPIPLIPNCEFEMKFPI
jgi:uncharacterized surface protein with fasciclin (FAS1) repeats